MKLTIKKRAAKKKGELTQIRHLGDVPAILYKKDGESETIIVSGREFSKVLREIKKGFLPTTIFELKGKTRSCKAIVKEAQYHPTTYKLIHLDFQELIDDVAVEVKVPIQCVGQSECTGIKLGGFLRQVRRHIKVHCLPKDIPTAFDIDVRNLGIGDAKRVCDIDMGKGRRCLFPMHEIVAVIAKR